MADILIDNQSVPSTPASGKTLLYVDSTAKLPAFKNDAGRASVMGGSTLNASTANLAPTANTDTYLTDSDLLIPSFGLQAKTQFRWVISASKTAAATATPVWTVRIGTNRTTSDTSRLALTGPAQTAAADVGVFTLYVTVRSVSASGTIQGTIIVNHNGAATGFANNDAGAVEGTSSTFDNTALAGSYIGLSLNTGASAAWTITQVRAEAMW